eukprot:CAMPEP_0197301650 /NCGR_PEP_ID=MMETSP0890-20130614/50533_1 /TAXON_ID=44058 ORGANISM="Aureoumbra lagunensis, Strain CCMP1510" /NCGR_SAMPLE_ID=MMETSP0890 /ASSEMBLY_ACC=CAM_ASM_000533 /LENGTH=150 /DNA_ID=CAMNT_0042781007 /DNA_START=183 /DNA_END=635 /DNA_ORIENTATION=-
MGYGNAGRDFSDNCSYDANGIWNITTEGDSTFFFGAHNNLTLTSPNDGFPDKIFPQRLEMKILAAADGPFSFKFGYITEDFEGGPERDPFYVIVNGEERQLTDDVRYPFEKSGFFEEHVHADEYIGFIMKARDSIGGAAKVTITDINAPC